MAKDGTHTLFNLSIVLALCLGSLTYGYDFSIISTTLGQPGFYEFFKLTQDATDVSLYEYTNQIIGAMNGLFSAGGMTGALIMGWLCDARGRQQALAVSSIVAIIGGALQAGSVAISMLLVARFITGIGVGMLVTLVPIFQSEIAPPASRGFLVGQHGFILVVGYALAGWAGYASYFAKNLSFQWRFPLALQCIWPLALLIVLPWIPESPRWLLSRGRKEDAWKVVSRLHASPSDPEQTFAHAEYLQMSRQVDADQAKYGHIGVLDLFRIPAFRKRMICGGVTMWAAEASGNLVVYNYAVILYQGLGYRGSTPLLLSAVYVSYAAAWNYISALLMDKVGRVRLMFIGFTGCMISLCGEAAMVAKYTTTLENVAGLRAGVFFLFLFVTFYGGCCDATTFVYCAEIFPTHIRPKGMAYCIAVLFLSTIPFLESAPTAFAAIGWKFYLVFIILTAINAVIIFFFFPETRGLSLEDINEIFGEEVAIHLSDVSNVENKIEEGHDGKPSRPVTDQESGSKEATHHEEYNA